MSTLVDKIVTLMEKMTFTEKLELNELLAISLRKDVRQTTMPISPKTKPRLQTEDLGKKFEMAICLAYGIPYDGPYKYGMELPEKLKPRLSKLLELFPNCRHTARGGARYDFTSVDETKYLSAKTTKGEGKVAPQGVAQAQPEKFCKDLKIQYTTIPALKEYIQKNKLDIIPVLITHTFDCPIIYYNQQKDTIRYVTLNTPIEWDTYGYRWTCDWTNWNNSSILKIIIDGKETSLLEFQFHTASRSNMAVRWFFDNFLDLFKKNLSIIDL
jgi:hypothetical protein